MLISSTTPSDRLAERLHPLGYPVVVETGDARAAEFARTLWGRWPQLATGEPLALSIQIDAACEPQTGKEPQFRVSPAGFGLTGAGSAFFDAEFHELAIQVPDLRDSHFLNSALLTALDYSLFTPLHAAAVARDGVGLLLCGDSGAGKSTLTYACARRGWTLISDDSVHLVPGSSAAREGNGPMISSLSSVIHLRKPAQSLFAELKNKPLGVAPNGKTAIEISAAEAGFRTARNASIERCIFLARRPGPAQMSPLDPGHAVQYFLKYLWQPDLRTHRRRLEHLVQHTGASLFTYENIEDAVEVLEGLLNEEGVAA